MLQKKDFYEKLLLYLYDFITKQLQSCFSVKFSGTFKHHFYSIVSGSYVRRDTAFMSLYGLNFF